MIFASDNWAGAAPQISENLARHCDGFATAYGDSDLDDAVTNMLQDVFETECQVFFVGTGTAANSLAFAACMKPGGVTFCHNEAHLVANEGGAPEFLTSGGRLCAVGGAQSKIDPDGLSKAVSAYPANFNHLGQGVMTSITQTTEGGTCYSLDEIDAIGSVAHDKGLALHMDGARFANALVNLDCSPAEMTWKRGVDLLSFGGTKNGCWCAEALLVFNPERAESLKFIRKRMGHLFSKTRFISAQFEAYLKADVWLDLARHSNRIGIELVEMIRASNQARLAWESDTNQVFMIAKKQDAENWLSAGAKFYPFATPKGMEGDVAEDEHVYRLVTAFCSTSDDVKALAEVMQA